MTSICKNCNSYFQGNYCNNCGQTANTHEINFQSILHEIQHTFLHIDKDSILLMLKNSDGKIEGKFDISYFEKDAKRGSITNGQMKCDTLYAIYISIQEGEQSDCEVAFLKKNDTYILTNDFIGEENYQYNAEFTKGSFKNKAKIKFDGDTLKLIIK